MKTINTLQRRNTMQKILKIKFEDNIFTNDQVTTNIYKQRP